MKRIGKEIGKSLKELKQFRLGGGGNLVNAKASLALYQDKFRFPSPASRQAPHVSENFPEKTESLAATYYYEQSSEKLETAYPQYCLRVKMNPDTTIKSVQMSGEHEKAAQSSLDTYFQEVGELQSFYKKWMEEAQEFYDKCVAAQAKREELGITEDDVNAALQENPDATFAETAEDEELVLLPDPTEEILYMIRFAEVRLADMERLKPPKTVEEMTSWRWDRTQLPPKINPFSKPRYERLQENLFEFD